MNTVTTIHELAAIDRWVRHFARAPHQHNDPHQSDAELIAVPGTDRLLAITIDTVSEEITTGLYLDPFTMGWVTIMASLSDLAAVGADPLGLVVSVSLEPSRDDAFRARLAQGMAAACDACGTFLLGGDTNASPAPALTGCAIGTVPHRQILTRLGCRPGDAVYLSGPAGSGSALGLARFLRNDDSESSYRPVARVGARHVLRRFAGACMDTSDGLLATLDQLMRLNGAGFEITRDVLTLLDPSARQASVAAGLPPWMMLAGPHGEFELVFTVHPGRADYFTADARTIGWEPLPIGVVTDEIGVSLTIGGRPRAIDTGMIRNLFENSGKDISRYINGLMALEVNHA